MKRFLPAFASLALSAALALPASAEVASPTVREGDFYCFRGMPASQINKLPALEKRPGTMFRVDKLGNSKFDNTDGHDLREIKTEGSPRILVILVEFQDVIFQRVWGEPHEIINEMLNADNYTFQGATGSAADFYSRVSKGQFKPQFDLYGPVKVSKKEIDYVNYDYDDTYVDAATGKDVTCYPASRMVEEAVKALDDQINFADYDLDGDGNVDFVYLFFAGQGATTGGGTDRTIWPHAFTLTSGIGTTVELDGVTINRYCCSSELGSKAKLSGIGTFCHEFGHVLGLPDLYDTENNTGQVSKCFTPGSFDCMDAGNYNNDEHTPPMFSAYEQYALEWMKPSPLSGTGRYNILPLEARPFAYQVPSATNPKEYYILEGRGRSFLDQHLPGFGLLAWHIDFSLDIWQAGKVNNNPNHMYVDLIEADNNKSNSTRNGDPFPGVNGVCEFTQNVSPAFKDWKNKPLGYNLTEISANFDGTVSFLAKGASQIASEADLAAAAPKAYIAGPDAITLEWQPIEHANEYFVSVFDYNAFDGTPLPLKAFVDGYYFRSLGNPEAENGLISVDLTGLPSNKRLGIMLYATNDLNASRMKAPLVFNTVDGSDFAAASPNMILGAAGENSAIAEWDAVEGADSYDFQIVTRKAGSQTSELKLDFTGSNLPEGWTGSGKYDTRKFGAESPSYSLAGPEASLASKLYDDEISNISFWACKRYADELCELDVYSLDASGNPTLAYVLDNLSKDGERIELAMPKGTHGLKMVYHYRATDLFVYLDDFAITFHEGYTDTPVADATVSRFADNAAQIYGLTPGVEYVAYVTPNKNDGTVGARSNEITFRVENLPASGVDEISTVSSANIRVEGMNVYASDPSVPFNIYGVDGMIVAKNCKGVATLPARGVYLVNINGKTVKIRI